MSTTPKETARELVGCGTSDCPISDCATKQNRIAVAIEAAVLEEREACAKLADKWKLANHLKAAGQFVFGHHAACAIISEEIRLRTKPRENNGKG